MKLSPASLSKRELTEKYTEILFGFESIIIDNYERNVLSLDNEVLHIYEALAKYVKAKLTKYPLPENTMKEGIRDVYAKMLELLLELSERYSYEELQECLKVLIKSVKFWSKERGSKGYLSFLNSFNR